jgi:ComF family protein
LPEGDLQSRGRSALYRLYHLAWTGLDLVLPPVCGGCGKAGFRWCPTCHKSILALPPPLCDVCGTPRPPDAPQCVDCRASRPRFHMLRSWSVFAPPVRSALLRLKYGGDLGLGEALVPQLAEFVRSLGWRLDVLVPVPLGASRLRERGYNQAALIGRPLSLAMGLGYAPRALIRARETRSQVGLTRAERRDNVRGAFHAEPGRIHGQSVLLVDDVATTGATLSSCAEALAASGAQGVFAITVARALPRPGLTGV